jgi:hypothetical protein
MHFFPSLAAERGVSMVAGAIWCWGWIEFVKHSDALKIATPSDTEQFIMRQIAG